MNFDESKSLFSEFIRAASIQEGVAFDVPLGMQSTLKAGGKAVCVFRPKRMEDLVAFRQWNQAQAEPLEETILGGLSNVLIRDGGLGGVVLRLPVVLPGEGEDGLLILSGGLPNGVACAEAQRRGLSGIEFLSGIPGTIGGAVAMNAGAYGKEVSEALVWIEALTKEGHIIRLSREVLPMRYRHGGLPEGTLVIRAAFRMAPEAPEAIARRQAQLAAERRGKIRLLPSMGTAGSAFKNPPEEISEGRKAWQLIDAVGGRGLRRGGAMFAEEHANFLLNMGGATARDLEALGEEIRHRVWKAFGVKLVWEIKILGH